MVFSDSSWIFSRKRTGVLIWEVIDLKASWLHQVRMQETQAELPRGCIPRSVEVILRAEAVESAQAGDRCDFTGTLIVVPDVSAMVLAGTDLCFY